MGASFRLGFILVFNQKKRKKKLRLGDIEGVRSVLCEALPHQSWRYDIHPYKYNTSTFLALYN